MYNWAMEVWNMSANEFIWGCMKWFAIFYVLRFMHREINMGQLKRFHQFGR